MEEFKIYNHNPPHYYKKNAKYFITGSIYKKRDLLKSSEAKNKLYEYFIKSANNFNWVLEDWVILNNHYHLMLESPDNPATLSEMMGNIHRYSAIWINKNVRYDRAYDKVWHNYWDKCLTYERSYFTRLNYIWFNPVKHKLADDAKDYEFGSYFQRFKLEKDYLENIKKLYPCDNLLEDDNF
ncbi:MAG: transposase [Ignavibacteria bacterium]|nr:transposase [Ignavibacteria bacterium]